MTKARSPVRPMGESGKKNDGVGRTREKDEQWKPAFIGQGTGKPEEDSGRGLFERSEFRSPDDGVACDRLGPITAAALLLCHPALDAGSSSCPKRNNNGDSLPDISGSRVKVQLTKAGISGSRTPMRDDWTPSRHTLREIGEGIKKSRKVVFF